ncbi:MAG: hypothetical protein RLY20_2654, partial [Verrucomicrobiota bacterium]
MKLFRLSMLALLMPTLSALAQLDVEIVLDQDKFLPGEQ